MRPDSGQIFIDGDEITQLPEEDLNRIRKKIGVVFQEGALFDSLTVYENVELPLTYRGMPSSERKKNVMEALDKVGMFDDRRHYLLVAEPPCRAHRCFLHGSPEAAVLGH